MQDVFDGERGPMPTIGIDLGLEYTTVAHAVTSQTGEVESRVIPTSRGSLLTPSSVALYQRRRQWLVGEAAWRYACEDPENSVQDVARLLGRRYTDPEVELLRGRTTNNLVPISSDGENWAGLELGGVRYRPEDLVPVIIGQVKRDAEVYLGQAVDRAVLTVPGRFGNDHRRAPWLSARRTGLEIVGMLDTAKAVGYGMRVNLATDEREPGPDSRFCLGHRLPQYHLVYFLGTSEFEFALMQVVNETVLLRHHGGDARFRGFDDLVLDYVIDQLEARQPGTEQSLREDRGSLLLLKDQVRRANTQLSNCRSAIVACHGLLRRELDVYLELYREQFEFLIHTSVADTVTSIQNALEGLRPAQIASVLLAGRSTLVPLVRQVLAEAFGQEKITTSVDPMTCRAIGAALFGAHRTAIVCPENHSREPGALFCVHCGVDLCVEPWVRCSKCGGLHPTEVVECVSSGQR